MDKRECTKAIRKAYRIFGSIAILKQSNRSVRLSRAKALELIKTVADDAEIKAEWLDDDDQYLMIG